MPLQLTPDTWRALFPQAPQAVLDAFARDSKWLAGAGILETRTRLAYALANVEHECGGFTIKNLTESIRYTAERMAVVWPNRFSSADAVRARYGTGAGWQSRAFDEIYGGRMGNRPGTSDGSTYIGRGGPQITGRGAYRQLGTMTGLDLVNSPDLATLHEHQPAILASFWTWKDLNKFADRGDFIACVEKWNGARNGLPDRRQKMAGNEAIIERLTFVAGAMPILDGV